MTQTAEERKAYQQARYYANHETAKAKQRAYCKANPEKVMWTQARIRANRKGLPFTIAVEDIQIPPTCPILGIELKSGGGRTGHSPSLDRLNSSKGYTPDNIWVISDRANRIKNDSTPDELILLARAIAEKTAHGLYNLPSAPMEVVITPGTY